MVPAGSTYMADNVVVALLPDGFEAYGGYTTLPWANMGALVSRFPNALHVGIATRDPFAGARCADAEPGTFGYDIATNAAQAAKFLAQYAGHAKPIVYTMASWAASLEDYLTAHGHARSTYLLWTAHYTGLHLCGPRASGGCGYSYGADITQYATGLNDYSVCKPGTLTAEAPGGTPVTGNTLRLGNSGDQVKTLQSRLNVWARTCGFGVLIPDGDFGGKTYAAVRLFQRYKKLPVTGAVDVKTYDAIKAKKGLADKARTIVSKKPAKPRVPSGSPEIKFGDAGKDVAAMQYYLRNSGIEGVRGIEADGKFGSGTLTALRNFQKHAGFKGSDIDGVYGPATARKLAKYAVS